MKNSWAVRDATDEVLELSAQLGVKNIVVNYQNCVLFRHYSFAVRSRVDLRRPHLLMYLINI